MAKKRVTVTQESETGRNTKFHDNKTGENMTRNQFVKKMKKAIILTTMSEISTMLKLQFLILIRKKIII